MSKVFTVLFNAVRIIIGVALTILGALTVLAPIVSEIIVYAPSPDRSFISAVFGMACGVIVLLLGLRCLRIIEELPF